MRQIAYSGLGPARQVLVEWPGDDKMNLSPETSQRMYWLDRSKYQFADPECLFRIRDVYPGSRILTVFHSGSRISDPQKRGGGKNLLLTPFCRHKFHKIILLLKTVQKKKLLNWQGIKVFLPSFCHLTLRNTGRGDPGSKIRDLEKPYPGSDPQHCKIDRTRARQITWTDQYRSTHNLTKENSTQDRQR
jgi:hypothetical protein